MFLAPFFLLGLIAIGVPLWLHRVARADPTRHPFPSLMLLEERETQRTAKRTLRYWLLLLLRVLLIAALALAFAGPMWRDEAGSAYSANTRLHAIVLDASLSMQHGERWQRALDAVDSILQSLRASDKVMLVRAGGRSAEIVQEPVPAREVGTLRTRLAALAPGRERLDFGVAMSAAEQWLRTPRPPVLLHFVSDFQRSGAPLRFADLEPPADTQVLMHDVHDDPGENVFIDKVTLGAGETRSLEVDVKSTYAAAQSRELIVAIDGQEFARRRIELAPAQRVDAAARIVRGEGGGRAIASDESVPVEPQAEPAQQRIVFEDLALTAGTHRIEVRLEPSDGLADDDRYYAVLEHAAPRALLLTQDKDADEAAYFAAAIGALSAPRVQVTQESAGRFENTRLGEHAMVVVPDAFALSSAMAAQLDGYVKGGGALLTTLGTGMEAAQHPLFEDWRIGKARPRLGRIGQIDTSHPILRDAPAWHRVRLFRQRDVAVGTHDRVLIADTNGTPLLVERALGAGRMLVLTVPIERQWNDLAIHPAFVEFVAEATRYLIGGDSSLASVTVGAPVITGLTASAGGQIFDPSGKRVLGLASTDVERLIPTEVGFYEIRHPQGVRWLAVNTDRRESDLRQLAPDYLARWQALRQRPARNEPQEITAVEVEKRRSLGPYLLWIAAALLLVELLMANRYLSVRREVAR